MKMVIDGFAGAGTITMGGYDYHTGDRETGERRDLRECRLERAVCTASQKVRVALEVSAIGQRTVGLNVLLEEEAANQEVERAVKVRCGAQFQSVSIYLAGA